MAFSRRGRPLAEEEKSTDAAKARARAMELLAGQELSSGQLYERLGRRFTQPTAAAVVAEMVERQYVDDERYALTWKPPPPSWKDGIAASWPQGGKTLLWLRWPGGGLHIRSSKRR